MNPDITFETDVCVIGAGPAGLVVASQLLKHGLNVVVLESGAGQPDPAVLALNQGSVVGQPYAGLAATRHRHIGGTTAIWNTPVCGEVGAKYVPLDPADFEERAGWELSGWPLGSADLAPYYARALALVGLPPSADAADADGMREMSWCPLLAGPIVPATYRFGTRRALLDASLAAIRLDPETRLCTHATVLGLETDPSGSRVTHVRVGTPDGPRWDLGARLFVLAGGAIENARLLLASPGPRGGAGGLGNESGWVGRCFMEHPRDSSLFLEPRDEDFYRQMSFFDVHQGRDGHPVLGRLALSQSAIRSGELLNTSGTLFPVIGRTARIARKRLGRLARGNLGRRFIPAGGHGWSAYPFPRMAFAGVRVLLNLEQSPHPDNRIRLDDRRDALGVPRPVLHWKWMPEDQARLVRVRKVIGSALEGAGLGRVEIDTSATIDPNAHHHAGTTRMHEDPHHGVVDANGRVHSLENIYVAGSSVFPTVGFANPVLTVVALALRLADHLAGVHEPD